MTTATAGSQLINAAGAERILGVPASVIRSWARYGRLRRVGSCPTYQVRDILELEAQRQARIKAKP